MVAMLLAMVYGKPANCLDDQILADSKKAIEVELAKLKLGAPNIT
jgi:hypothetical protein